MATGKPGNVRETGAEEGDFLIGIEPMNRNLLIRVHEYQRIGDGGRVIGPFDLLRAGNGDYHQDIARYVRQESYRAGELIEALRAHEETCTHIVNKNSLLRVWFPMPSAAGAWCFSE